MMTSVRRESIYLLGGSVSPPSLCVMTHIISARSSRRPRQGSPWCLANCRLIANDGAGPLLLGHFTGHDAASCHRGAHRRRQRRHAGRRRAAHEPRQATAFASAPDASCSPAAPAAAHGPATHEAQGARENASKAVTSSHCRQARCRSPHEPKPAAAATDHENGREQPSLRRQPVLERTDVGVEHRHQRGAPRVRARAHRICGPHRRL